MRGDHIRFRAGYRFQLVNDYRVRVDVMPDYDIETEFVRLDRDGVLLVKHGYAWDGPSDPFMWIPMPKRLRNWLLRKFMRGSLVHDVLAQLCRDGNLDRAKCFTAINCELNKICLEDGMCRIRSKCVFVGVEYLGGRKWVQWGDGGKQLINAP